jgi:hypothetical protein
MSQLVPQNCNNGFALSCLLCPMRAQAMSPDVNSKQDLANTTNSKAHYVILSLLLRR